MGKKTITELGFVRLDGRKKSPLFQQLYDSIRSAILDGQLAADSRIPSSRDLVLQLQVSRTTVVSALDRLIAEGYLQTISGSGTFVSKEIPNDNPFVNSSPLAAKSPVLTSRAVAPQSPLSSYVSKSGRRFESISQKPGPFGMLKPFRPGVPALDEFPVKVWAKIVRKVWNDVSENDLSYGEPAGYWPLRESIAEYLRAHRGVRCDTEQVMIVSGTQQAFDVIARLCVDPGDQMLFENPGYIGARDAFAAQGAKIIPMPIDDDGAKVDSTIRKYPNAAMAYITPSHQYPMGVTLPIERRMELINWAGRTGGLIIEDDYDSEYRYSQKPIPALQGLDSAQRTIYVGSFSKVVFPAISIGYAIVPPAMVSVFENALSLGSRPVSLIDQIVADEFIREGHFGRHLRRMRNIHSSRRQMFVAEVEKRLPDKLAIGGSKAGLHCTATLNNGMADTEAARRLEAIGIITRSLSHYYLRGTPPSKKANGLVFGFACSSPKQIVAAVKKMATVL